MINNYAHVVNGFVMNLTVADEEWVQSQENPKEYVVYTYAAPAYINGQYLNGFFYKPQPYPSWTMDDNSGEWLPPVPKPINGALGHYFDWSEELRQWTPRQEAIVWNAEKQEWEPTPGFGFNPDFNPDYTG
jgi:hypothetical protein